MKTFLTSILSLLLILPLGWTSLPASVKLPGSIQSTNRFSAHPPARSEALFIENVGQFDRRARFQIYGIHGRAWLSEDGIWITVLDHAPALEIKTQESQLWQDQPFDLTEWGSIAQSGTNLHITFEGLRSPFVRMEPFNRIDASISYFMGNDPARWHSEVPVWGGVRYLDVYPGVDLEITSQGDQIALRLVLRDPGLVSRVGSLRDIQLRVTGAESIELDGDQLFITTAAGKVPFPLLQLTGNEGLRLPFPGVEGSLVAAPFASPNPQAPEQHTNGPSDLRFATFLGGSSYDYSDDIITANNGSSYVVGMTGSNDFPSTPGSFDPDPNGDNDVFLVKMNKDGSALESATYIGGTGDDRGEKVILGEDGAIYITGWTTSVNFPVTSGSFDTNLSGDPYRDIGDAFVVKLNPAGTLLEYGTFLGGSQNDWSFGFAIDSRGSVYVTGSTQSSDFPTTPGAFDVTFEGESDAYLVQLDPSGTALEYATFLGGSSQDAGRSVYVDPTGAAYVTGSTNSPDLPTTAHAFDASFNGVYDCYLYKLNSAGSAPEYATYIGGSDSEGCYDIAVDAHGAAYMTGYTLSLDFPTTPGAYDQSFSDTPYCKENSMITCFPDVIIVKVDASGSALEYSTLIGGISGESGASIAVDADGAAYVTGWTNNSSFPTTPGALDTTFNDSPTNPVGDIFVTRLNAAGSQLEYATFLGGSGYEPARSIALDSSGAVLIAGDTYSSNFPITPGAFDSGLTGQTDAVIVKMTMLNRHAIFLPYIYRTNSFDTP